MIEEGIELQAPIVTVNHRLHVGPDVAPGAPWDPSGPDLMPLFQSSEPFWIEPFWNETSWNETPWWHSWFLPRFFLGAKRDGTGQLVDYLIDDAGPGGHARRFGEEPPTVRIAEGATPGMVSAAIRAVQAINASLPDTWKLRFASEPATGTAARPLDGEIVIDFRPNEDWPVEVPPGWRGGGFAQRWFDPGQPAAEIVSGRVWIDTGPQAHGQFRPDIIAHEILYTLGRNRANGTRFRNTLMNGPSQRVPEHLLHPLDREALFAVYGWLPPNTPTDEIAETLGPWSEVSDHLVGSVPISSRAP